MAANRYGRIYHSDNHFINLRFPSADARRKYAEDFEKYHAGHDHDGEVPRFEDTPAATIGNMEANRVHDAHSVSIDGYATYEIEDYHNPDRWNTYNRSRYRPPTCCVAPTISVNRTFIDSSELTRHELSEIFMDMPEEDFQSLLKSVEENGFKDPVIRMIDEQVLDGWHRYRAAKELNLLRKLRFQQWKEQDEGDPAAFVYARNMERRHLTPGQRAQIAVSFNKRAGAGNPNLTSPNDEVKTREQLAKEANVGTSTIDRAAIVDDLGRGDEVIRGEKTQGEVITEETKKSLWEQIKPAISEWKKAREGVGYASKSMFIKAALRFMGLPSHTVADVKVLQELLKLLTSEDTDALETLVRKQLDGNSLWGDASPPEQQDTEQPKQTAEDREANAELKRKKQSIKSIWDTRIQAARDYTSDGDTELNLHLTLPELEKGFLKHEAHAYCADAFRSALQRTSETSFNICLEKTLAADVSLEDLEAEYKALSTYAIDILAWEKQAWIQELIAKKRKKAEKAEPEVSVPDDEDEKRLQELKERLRSELNSHWLEYYSWADLDEQVFIEAYGVDAATLLKLQQAIEAEHPEPGAEMNALWDAFNKRLPKWKAKYADSGYKENDLIQGATEAELFDALRDYRESERTGPVTAEEIKDVTDLMKSQSYPFARRVRTVLRDKQERVSSDAGASLEGLNLPAFNSFLESLLYHVGPVKHQQTQDEASVAVFDALVDCDLTEREQLSLLLDCAQSIVLEYESLDNEVLCPDDEADRQAMNSDLVTEVEEGHDDEGHDDTD